MSQTHGQVILRYTTARFKTIILFSSLAIVVSLYSTNFAIVIPDFHLDGAYQTATTLFRASKGQQIGYDFFPYLGPIVLLLYIPFRFLGASMADSLLVTHFALASLFLISIFLIARLLTSNVVTIVYLFLGASS